jgi:hypothetical protein
VRWTMSVPLPMTVGTLGAVNLCGNGKWPMGLPRLWLTRRRGDQAAVALGYGRATPPASGG